LLNIIIYYPANDAGLVK